MKASEIVEQIEAILKERGIKKGDFYKACGISASVVSNWRNNKNYPLFPTLQTINEYLGTSFVVSLNDDDSLPYAYQAMQKAKFELAKEKEKPAPDWDRLDAELVERLTALTPGERDKVDAFVQGLLASRED